LAPQLCHEIIVCPLDLTVIPGNTVLDLIEDLRLDPMPCIGIELEAPPMIETINCLDEPDGAC
jgi:hypothetical protein